MRVLHVYKTYLPDDFTGIPRAIWEIAEATSRLGVTAEVLSVSRDPNPATLQIDHHVSHRTRQDLSIASASFSLGAFKRFRELSNSADVIHFHFPWPAMDIMALTNASRRPAVVTYHSDVVRQKILRRFYAPLMHRFLAHADRLVATSPQYAQTSLVLRRYRDKVTVIPLGMTDRVSPSEEVLDRWRRRFPKPFLLFVGALRYYKGLPFLFEAARETGIPVVVVGAGTLPADLVRMCPPELTLLGECGNADKEALLTLSQAFVFPSHLRAEAFGVALLEAARAGKAMISCEIGTGTSYVNVDGVTGWTVVPADAKALAETMRAAMSSTLRAKQMGDAARQRYLSLFAADAMGRAYARLYQEVLESPPTASGSTPLPGITSLGDIL